MARKLMMNNNATTINNDNIVMDSLITWFDGRYYNANSFVDRVTNSIEAEVNNFSSFTHDEIGSAIPSSLNSKTFLSPTIYNIGSNGMTIELVLAGNAIGGSWCPMLYVSKSLLQIRSAYPYIRILNDSIDTTVSNLWDKSKTNYHIFTVTIKGDLSSGEIRYNSDVIYNLKMSALTLTNFRIGVYPPTNDSLNANFISLRAYDRILTEDELLINRTYEINKIGG